MPRREFLRQAALLSALAAGPAGWPLRARADGAPPASGDGRPTLYCVGYAHLDTEWRWSYPLVIGEFLWNTLRDNFALFERFPDYIFNFTGANRYRLMKEYFPADYERLKGYVAAGRWFPAGSSWEEGIVDEPSSESILRHVLYGNRYFLAEFGKASCEFMLPDSFGFPASLPGLLAHAGLKGFSTQKLTWGCSVGIPFNVGVWEGLDGRGVVAALNATPYDAKLTGDLTHDPKWIERLQDDARRCGVAVDYRYYGTGDRGGAPDARSVEWLELSLHGTGPIRIVSATGAQMFEELTAEQIGKLPRYQGDLLLTQHSAGTPSSQAFMKKLNRKNELRADEAERAAAAADWLGGLEYPRERITRGWRMLLAGQFHDVLAGTAKPDAYAYAWNDGFVARNQLNVGRDAALAGVARALDTRAQGVPLVVFNPLSIDREDVVEAEVEFPETAPAGVAVHGPDGQPVPSQLLHRDGRTARIIFLARVPSVGFAVFDVRAGAAEAPDGSPLKATHRTLENGRYRVVLNDDGDIASIRDLAADRELLAEPARLAFLRENPTRYPAWNMDWDDASRPPYAHVEGPAKIQIVERGPVRVALQVERRAQGSTIVQTVRLAAGEAGDRVECDTFIDWRTEASALKAVFPLTVRNLNGTYNWGAGTVERATDGPKLYEWPSHQWFDLTDAGGAYGVSVLEDCKYGSDKPDDHTLRLTLQYTPGLKRAPKYSDQRTQDFGRHRCLYALAGHAGNWRDGAIPWRAARLNQPLTAFQAAPHEGARGKSFSFVRVSDARLMVKALKQAEAGDELVIRLQELDGRPVPGAHVAFASEIASAREVDGQERRIGRASLSGGRLAVACGPYGLRSFAVRLRPPATRAAPPISQPLGLAYNETVTSRDGQLAPQGMGGTGRSYPAETFPSQVDCGGVAFRFGSPDGPNALACRGQTIELPEGPFDRLYLIAATADDPLVGRFLVDGRPVEVDVASWSGFIGQPDYRLWNGIDFPGVTYDWGLECVGVAPGYLRRDPIAWFCSHTHATDGTNEIYRYCYLFRYAIDLAGPARVLTLPHEPRIKLMAISVASGSAGAVPVTPDLGVL